MADLYADEQFPLKATQHLRALGHDVLTVQEAGNANRGISDDAVLAFATTQNRAVLTLNRRDFIRLHKQSTDHAGIIVCKDDRDKQQLAERINRAIQAEVPLKDKLVRVQRDS
jgi:predicted nuclease of predicted toxin-antitoxin system